MQIVNPTYSFVKFGSPEAINNCCDGDQEFCIPVIEETDTYFQIKVTSDVYAEIQDMMDDNSEDQQSAFHLLLLAGSGNTPSNFRDNLLRDWTLQDGLNFQKSRTGLYEITLQWKNPFKDIQALLDCGDCFQLGFLRAGEFSPEFSDEFSDEFDIDGSTVSYDFIAISNCFKRACNDCFSSVLEYYNDDDYAEFRYCNVEAGVNRVRLPFYLLQPKMTEDKAVYRKSNGAIKQTKSLLTKEYQVLTDFFPEWLHDKLTVALAHDNINVTAAAYVGGISKSGEYIIDWSDNDCTAPANFKAMATPYAIRNNNCQDCQEVELCSQMVVPEFSFPDANVGDAYNFTLVLSGFQPTISNVVKPAWMSIVVSGSTLVFTGTPITEENDVPVSFTLTNPCTDPITISKTLNIDIMTPGMMIFWPGSVEAVPAGWLFCDGRAISRTTYAGLFGIIGTSFGEGDAATTFNLPAPQQKYFVGFDETTSPFNAMGTGYGNANNELTLQTGQLGKLNVSVAIDDFAPPGGSDAITRMKINGVETIGDGPSNNGGFGTEREVFMDVTESDPVTISPDSLVIGYIIKF